jgi:hypothetical protein
MLHLVQTLVMPSPCEMRLFGIQITAGATSRTIVRAVHADTAN